MGCSSVTEIHLLAYVWLIKLSRKFWRMSVYFPLPGSFPTVTAGESLRSDIVVSTLAGISLTWSLVRFAGPHSQNFWLLRSGVGPVISISKFPGDALLPVQGPDFENNWASYREKIHRIWSELIRSLGLIGYQLTFLCLHVLLKKK